MVSTALHATGVIRNTALIMTNDINKIANLNVEPQTMVIYQDYRYSNTN